MRALLDINVLIALLDTHHVFHSSARAWWMQHRHHGWASCPLTQNGCVRIIAQPSYPNTQPVITAVAVLTQLCADSCHTFWPDDVSLLESTRFTHHHVQGSRQLTDVYLLALAVRYGGRFVTFDSKISLDAVPGATSDHLYRLSA